MSGDSFERLLEEMPRIAKVVNAFSSQSVQERAYEALVTSLVEKDGVSKERGKSPKKMRTTKTQKSDASEGAPRPKKRQSPDSYDVIPDLNLRPAKGKSLRDFVAEKAPKTNEERFAVMVYYMEKQIKVSRIEPNHVYTCFKDANMRVPSKLRTVLSNAAHRKSWFSSPADGLKMTTIGENFVEHDLPRKKE